MFVLCRLADDVNKIAAQTIWVDDFHAQRFGQYT
jgi:hypothetical protein